MELSRLVARVIAVVYVSAGIAVLLRKVNFNDIADDFAKSPALTFFAGSFGMIIGTVLVHYHNIWVRNWTVLITIIGWLCLMGGLTVVVFPRSLSYVGKYYKRCPAWGIFMICFGLVLAYLGFSPIPGH